MSIFKNKIIKWTIIITGIVILFAAARAAYAGTLFLAADEFYPVVLHPEMRNDNGGDAWFGAVRDGHSHEGIDIHCTPGEDVFAPFDSTYDHLSYPYPEDTFWEGITINGTGIFTGYEFKIFYMEPYDFSPGEVIKKGQKIGIAQAISNKYSGDVTDHLHLELTINEILTDPTPYVLGYTI